jgi:hypothetical protein
VAPDAGGPGDVRLEGHVPVTALTGCPARVRIAVQGRDACGLLATRSVDVEIEDAAPPGISAVPSTGFLWPPNHRLATITADVSVTDNCPGAAFVLGSVTSSEPENGLGAGDRAPDIVDAETGTPDVELRLRSERAGPAEARVYTVAYLASDACGNRSEAVATVRVEHDRSRLARTGAPAPGAGEPAGRGPGPGASAGEIAGGAVPARTGLVSVHPSPFWGGTHVTYEVAAAGAVTVSVHDLAGRRVRTLASGERDPGRHTRSWDGRDDSGADLGAGIYFVRCGSAVRRAILMR